MDKKPLANDRDLWERQPEESRPAFDAFALYRDLTVALRSTTEVARRLSKSGQLIKRWSSAWSWVIRSDAYDAELDRQRREQAAEAQRKMVEAIADEAAIIRRVGVEAARVALEKIAARELNLDDVKAGELLTLARMGAYAWTLAARTERVNRGLPERGVVEVNVRDEGSEDLAGAVNRLADLLDVEPGEVIDLIAERQKRQRTG